MKIFARSNFIIRLSLALLASIATSVSASSCTYSACYGWKYATDVSCGNDQTGGEGTGYCCSPSGQVCMQCYDPTQDPSQPYYYGQCQK